MLICGMEWGRGDSAVACRNLVPDISYTHSPNLVGGTDPVITVGLVWVVDTGAVIGMDIWNQRMENGISENEARKIM